MSGNKALVGDLAILRAVVEVVDTCLREGIAVPDVLRELVTRLARRVRATRGGGEAR